METCESLGKAAAGLPHSKAVLRNMMRDLVVSESANFIEALYQRDGGERHERTDLPSGCTVPGCVVAACAGLGYLRRRGWRRNGRDEKRQRRSWHGWYGGRGGLPSALENSQTGRGTRCWRARRVLVPVFCTRISEIQPAQFAFALSLCFAVRNDGCGGCWDQFGSKVLERRQTSGRRTRQIGRHGHQ